jgi:glucose-fructose oxidoreductase
MPARPKHPPVRYAVVGLGWIAQTAVLPAFDHAKKNSRLTAFVSGTPKKLEKLSRLYGVGLNYSYDEYDDCLRSGEVDAVYIALPNHLHHEFAIRAAEAGVHVLCEKPLAVTERGCEDMIRAARDHRVLLMTAYRLHFERTNLRAAETVGSGKIGEPRVMDSVFTMQTTKGNVRLSRPDARGGGPLYDLGIYCINAARSVFDAEPIEVVGVAAAGRDERFRRCHETIAAVLRFKGGGLATFTCSFGAAPAATYRVIGTKGDLCVDAAYETSAEMTEDLTVDEKTTKRTTPKRDHFAPELLYFSDCVLSGQEPEPSGREGLADVRVIRAILRSVDEGRPVVLPPMERRRRPSMEQEIRRGPVDRRPLVAVEDPSRD